ncbi:SMP-30/gluconolactonase/LRE family protein [Opitutaceae bacterium]|nr:SMP-30/gluconolactonase/LRE family protein [Opitutaceae bacterium]
MPSPTPARFLILLTSLTASVFAQGTTHLPHIGEIERHDEALVALIEPGTKIEVLADGFNWSEGPVWDAAHNQVLFSDVPENRIHSWSEENGLDVYMEPSGYTGVSPHPRGKGSNGLTFDNDGRLVLCEHGDRRISVVTDQGGKRTITDHVDGKRFNSPNDLAIDTDGNIWFTDPPYGLPEGTNDPRRELDYAGVYLHRASTDKTELLTKELPWPNGIALSPDEQTLYVAQSNRDEPIVMAYPIKADLSLGSGKVIFDMSDLATGPGRGGNPDGLKVDQQGNLWISGRGGIQVVSPAGKHLGSITVGPNTANCGFGGPDGSILYITSDMYLVRIQTKVKGTGF